MLMLIKHEGLFRRLDIISPPPDQWCVCGLVMFCHVYVLLLLLLVVLVRKHVLFVGLTD